MSIQIHTATREGNNNRAMPAPESKTRSGITLRAISLGSLEILRQLLFLILYISVLYFEKQN